MIFNRVLMKANPNYFNLSEEEQESYRLNFFNEEDENSDIFDDIIGKELFGKALKDEDFKAFADKDYSKYNRKKTEFIGYGENKITITEFFMIENSLRDIKTVYDYDFLYEKNQIKLELENIEETGYGDKSRFENKEYEFTLRSVWARMIKEDKFYYVTLISASNHINDILLTYLGETISKFYPNDYIDVERNEDSLLGNFGVGIDAKGKEDYLEELKSRSYKKIPSIYEELKTELNNSSINGVIIEEPIFSQDENHMTIIVSSEETAKNISWLNFYNDIKANEVKGSVLDEITNKYKEKIYKMIESDYLDIENNFEPNKVVPIKKMRVIMSDQAMEDFENIMMKESKSEKDNPDD